MAAPIAAASPVREQRSLFGELIDWLLAPLLLLWPISVILVWVAAQGIANQPYDRGLRELARTLARQVVVDDAAGRSPRVRLALNPEATDMLRADGVDDIYFQVLGLRGEYLAGDRELPVPADDLPAVLDEVRFRDDEIHHRPVRVAFVHAPAPGAGGQQLLVQVAETLGKRSQLATEIIKGVIVPQFVILPLAVALIWLALSRGIAPLDRLQRRIRSRASHDLSPIDEREAPEEVAPLVGAINDLLARLDQSISAQKHFLADAAHQLKTPLAGLRMQAELAQREIETGEGNSQSVRRSLQQIARASQRAAHMVNQLLAMARAEDQGSAPRLGEVNLARLAIETVRDFVARALDKGIDLGYEGPQPDGPGHRFAGQALLVRELIRNLVDNALHYTPAGGMVTVRVIDDPFGQVCVLQVEDNGPGIPAGDRDLVFRPFFRALGTNVDGSGLGLAIVHEIVVRHAAEILLEDAQPRAASPGGRAAGECLPTFGPGARFTVRFAAAPGPDQP